jgi:hypothetical protein
MVGGGLYLPNNHHDRVGQGYNQAANITRTTKPNSTNQSLLQRKS